LFNELEFVYHKRLNADYNFN